MSELVLWTGHLRQADRGGQPFEAPLVAAPDGSLDALGNGKGLRLERQRSDWKGARWEAISVHEVSPVEFVIALADACRKAAP